MKTSNINIIYTDTQIKKASSFLWDITAFNIYSNKNNNRKSEKVLLDFYEKPASFRHNEMFMTNFIWSKIKLKLIVYVKENKLIMFQELMKLLKQKERNLFFHVCVLTVVFSNIAWLSKAPLVATPKGVGY